jgi:hypothetical protein
MKRPTLEQKQKQIILRLKNENAKLRLENNNLWALITKAEKLFSDDYEGISDLIKIADKVYCDETVWRISTKNFRIWVFVTDKGIR